MENEKSIGSQQTKKLFIFRWWFALPFTVIFYLISKIFNEATEIGLNLSAACSILAVVAFIIGINDIFHRNKKHSSFKMTK